MVGIRGWTARCLAHEGGDMAEGTVLVELSVSLDGYIAGPNVDVDRPLGDGGDRLHEWMFSGRTLRTQPPTRRPTSNTSGGSLSNGRGGSTRWGTSASTST